ncbi:hypothetical protein K1719_041685 [Acacia pycnantha]|nr:hypothetical protein K1719_041685 [Acacia pycnantha]
MGRTLQTFNADLTIGNVNPVSNARHVISSYNDLGVMLDLPSSNLRFFLVERSPYLTVAVTRRLALSIKTIHAILSFSSNDSLTKYTVRFNNGRHWFIYASSSINFSHLVSEITSDGFSGIIRIAVLPDSNPNYEAILDRTRLPLNHSKMITSRTLVCRQIEKECHQF